MRKFFIILLFTISFFSILNADLPVIDFYFNAGTGLNPLFSQDEVFYSNYKQYGNINGGIIINEMFVKAFGIFFKADYYLRDYFFNPYPFLDSDSETQQHNDYKKLKVIPGIRFNIRDFVLMDFYLSYERYFYDFKTQRIHQIIGAGNDFKVAVGAINFSNHNYFGYNDFSSLSQDFVFLRSKYAYEQKMGENQTVLKASYELEMRFCTGDPNDVDEEHRMLFNLNYNNPQPINLFQHFSLLFRLDFN